MVKNTKSRTGGRPSSLREGTTVLTDIETKKGFSIGVRSSLPNRYSDGDLMFQRFNLHVFDLMDQGVEISGTEISAWIKKTGNYHSVHPKDNIDLLTYAIRKGKRSYVDAVLRAEVDVTEKHLKEARIKGNKEIVNLLEGYYVSAESQGGKVEDANEEDQQKLYNVLFTVVERSPLKDVKGIVSYIMQGVDINAKNRGGEDILLHSIKLGKEDYIDYFCKNGAKIDRDHRREYEKMYGGKYGADQFGYTDLHYVAASGGDADMAKKLLEMGVDPNAVNNDGDTALHYAVLNGNSKVVDVLLAVEGINVNIQSGMLGDTPLHEAIKSRSVELVEKLLAVDGIKVDVENKSRRTARDLANGSSSKIKDIVESRFPVLEGVTEIKLPQVSPGVGRKNNRGSKSLSSIVKRGFAARVKSESSSSISL